MTDQSIGEKLKLNGISPAKKTKRSDFATQEEWDNHKLIRDAQKQERIKKGKKIASPKISNPGTIDIRVDAEQSSLEDLPINTLFSSVREGHNVMQKADSRRVINLSTGKSENFTHGQVFVVWVSPYAKVQLDVSSSKSDA